MEQQRYVGEILVRRGALEAARMEELLETAVEKDVNLLDLLFTTREQDEQPIVRALAEEVGIPFLEEIKPDEVSPELIELVPINFARTHGVLPIREENGRVVVAMSNPLDPTPLDDLRALLGKPIEPKAATGEKIEDVINAIFKYIPKLGKDAPPEALGFTPLFRTRYAVVPAFLVRLAAILCIAHDRLAGAIRAEGQHFQRP